MVQTDTGNLSQVQVAYPNQMLPEPAAGAVHVNVSLVLNDAELWVTDPYTVIQVHITVYSGVQNFTIFEGKAVNAKIKTAPTHRYFICKDIGGCGFLALKCEY